MDAYRFFIGLAEREQPHEREKAKIKEKWWQKLLLILGAVIAAIALVFSGLIGLMELNPCISLLQGLKSDAAQTFSSVLETMPAEEIRAKPLAAHRSGRWCVVCF